MCRKGVAIATPGLCMCHLTPLTSHCSWGPFRMGGKQILVATRVYEHALTNYTAVPSPALPYARGLSAKATGSTCTRAINTPRMVSLCNLVCLQDPTHTHLFPTCVYWCRCVFQATRLLIGRSPHANRTVSRNRRNHMCWSTSVAREDTAGLDLCSGVCCGGL